MRRPRLSAAVLALACSGPLVARAQDDDPARRAAAQALFDHASALMDKRDYANACPKLEEVGRLQPGKVGTLIALGECYAGEGRVASAWTTFRQAADRATSLNDARAADAQRRADALAPKLPRLTLRADAATKGLAELEVKRDGVAVGAGEWEIPIPIDPGEHVVEAQAPGRAPLRARVALGEGEAKDVLVALQPAQPAVAPPLVQPPPTPAPPAVSGSGRRIAGFVAGGVGVAGLGAGGILGIVTLVKVSHANGTTACMSPSPTNNGMCNMLYDAARPIQTGGIVAAVAGGVLVGAGVAIVATAPRAAGERTAMTTWSVVFDATGASVAGRF